MGCYQDQSVRDLDGFMSMYSSMTIETCLIDCQIRGFKYAGLQAGY